MVEPSEDKGRSGPQAEEKEAGSKKKKKRKLDEKWKKGKDEEPANLLSFGKRLAHTDQRVRDRGFWALKKFLKEQRELEKLDYLKLWKGLYYCMWMSDKRPVQQCLAVQMAFLINEVPPAKRVLWIEAFWEIMEEAWESLDHHRLNKYLLFIRIIMAEAFKVLREAGWQPAETRALGETLCRLVPKRSKRHVHTGWNTPSSGMLMQFNKILWQELKPQLELEPKASQDAVMELLEPFFVVLEGTGNPCMVKSVQEHVVLASPEEFMERMIFRLLQGAAKTDVATVNREIMYEIVDAFEKRHAATLEAEAAAREAMMANGGVLSGMPPPKAKPPAALTKKKKKKKKSPADLLKKKKKQMRAFHQKWKEWKRMAREGEKLAERAKDTPAVEGRKKRRKRARNGKAVGEAGGKEAGDEARGKAGGEIGGEPSGGASVDAGSQACTEAPAVPAS